MKHTGQGERPEPVTRMKRMERAGEIPLLPPKPAPYLVDWLFEIGPVAAGPMGAVPIGWRDLTAWQEIIGVELLPWEARVICSLSSAYLRETERARKADCVAPYTGEKDDVVERRETVGSKVDGWFKSMKGKKG